MLRPPPDPPREGPRRLLTGLVLGTLVATLRLLGSDPGSPGAFFHQNGLGPMFWLERDPAGPLARYGPGWLAWVSWLPTESPAALFLLQSTIGGLGLAAAWWLLTRARSTRRPGALLWLALALDPVGARVAASESYFGTLAGLLWLAAAALALAGVDDERAARPQGGQRRRAGAAALTAGLLVSLAARIHPLAWGPVCALGVVALLSGTPLLVLGFAGPLALGLGAQRAVLGGGLGRFAPGWGHYLSRARRVLLPGVPLAWWLARGARPQRRWLPAGALLVVLGIALTAILSDERAAVRGAWLRLYLPALLPLGLRWAAGPEASAGVASTQTASGVSSPVALRSRALATLRRGLLLLPALVCLGVGAADGLGRPTDAMEQQQARTWLRDLPDGAPLVWLGTAGRWHLQLPRPGGYQGFDEAELTEQAPADGWYYRSSLCSTAQGAAACAVFEARHLHRLTPVARWRLPARPSKPALRYLRDPASPQTVEVVLFRIGPE